MIQFDLSVDFKMIYNNRYDVVVTALPSLGGLPGSSMLFMQKKFYDAFMINLKRRLPGIIAYSLIANQSQHQTMCNDPKSWFSTMIIAAADMCQFRVTEETYKLTYHFDLSHLPQIPEEPVNGTEN